MAGEAGPETPRPALINMIEAAELTDDLMGGNRAMRKAAAKWLPREVEETIPNYNIRVGRATCFPFYKDTVKDLAGKPFVRPVAVEGISDKFSEFMRDVDGSGQNMTVFADDLMASSIHRGMYHVLVDAQGSGDTEASTNDRRVYVRKIDPVDMLDIRDSADSAGRMHVDYCRFSVSRAVDSSSFNQEIEVVIIELERPLGQEIGTKVEYEHNKDSGKWVESKREAYNPGGNGIPLFTHYTNQTGYFEAEPAMEDLAWVNLAHFQSRADHAHVMRVARLITLVTTGFKSGSRTTKPDEKGKGKIALGPLSRINSANEAAKVFFLEPSGRSIELSMEDMGQLEKEAKRLGARHHSSDKSHVTAESVVSDNQKLSNNLNGFTIRMETTVQHVLEAVGEWLNVVAENVEVTIYKDFDSKMDFDGGAKALVALSDVLTPKQKLIEAERYGMVRPNFPIDENLAELDQEAKAVEEDLNQSLDLETEEE